MSTSRSVVLASYGRRPVRFLDLWSTAGFRLKVYSIAARGERARDELVKAARDTVERRLSERATRHTHYGAGFVGIHDGRGENQVFLDRWVNENELLHEYWVSPSDRPSALTVPDPDHNSVCVWDLAVQCFERNAWLACVLDNKAGPDIEAYLARRMNTDI